MTHGKKIAIGLIALGLVLILISTNWERSYSYLFWGWGALFVGFFLWVVFRLPKKDSPKNEKIVPTPNVSLPDVDGFPPLDEYRKHSESEKNGGSVPAL